MAARRCAAVLTDLAFAWTRIPNALEARVVYPGWHRCHAGGSRGGRIILVGPKTVLVGLAEAAVRESTHRVERAIVNSGYRRPIDRVVINLARPT